MSWRRALKCKRLTIFSARRVKGKVTVAEMDSHFLTNAAFRRACEGRRGPFCHFKRLRRHHRPLPSVCAFFFHIPGLQPECTGQVFTSACRGEGENERAFSLIADGERVARRRLQLQSVGANEEGKRGRGRGANKDRSKFNKCS